MNRELKLAVTFMMALAFQAGCQNMRNSSGDSVADPFDFEQSQLVEIEPVEDVKILTIGSPDSRGQVVIEYSNDSNYARSYWVSGRLTPPPGEISDFDRGNPANLILQLDSHGKTVLCMVFGQTYMSNHAANIQHSDGSLSPNNPEAYLDGSKVDIISILGGFE